MFEIEANDYFSLLEELMLIAKHYRDWLKISNGDLHEIEMIDEIIGKAKKISEKKA